MSPEDEPPPLREDRARKADDGALDLDLCIGDRVIARIALGMGDAGGHEDGAIPNHAFRGQSKMRVHARFAPRATASASSWIRPSSVR
jgi:hypothetical protein